MYYLYLKIYLHTSISTPALCWNESRLVVEQRLTPSYIIIMVIICLK